MKITPLQTISPNTARVFLVLMFIAFSALPVGLFFAINGNEPLDLLGRAALLGILAYNVKALVDAFAQVEEAEITSIVQCLPWRLAAAKKRKQSND